MDKEPSQLEITEMPGLLLLEFGASWCGYCQAARAIITSALARYPVVRHIKIEDAKGRRLGRLFGVKLWPTLVFLKDGIEVTRLVRPTDPKEIMDALAQLS